MSEVTKVALIGGFDKPIRAACISASRSAGLALTVVFRTGRCRAVAVGADTRRPLFIRWVGRKAPRVSWTFAPELFSPIYKRQCLRVMADLLTDPAVTKQMVLLGRANNARKTPPVVS